jgi:plasmid stability protein
VAKAKSTGPTPPGSRFVRLELTEDQHSRLRVVAAQAGLSMAAFARMVVIRELDAPAGKPTGKRPKSE